MKEESEKKTKGTSNEDSLQTVAIGAETTSPSGSSSLGGQGPSSAAVHSSPGDTGTRTLEDLFACSIPDCPDCEDYERLAIPTCGDASCLNLDCLEGTSAAPAASESLVPFVFGCAPHDFNRNQYVDCSHPTTHTAFWDENDGLNVADMTSNDTFKVLCYEQQRRASSRPYYTWYCDPIGPADPATVEYMRSISS